MKHPQQPVIMSDDGVIRFKGNKIIELLFDRGLLDLNQIAVFCAIEKIPDNEQEQLAQLLGYSVSGYGDLSYVSDKSYFDAERKSNKIISKITTQNKQGNK